MQTLFKYTITMIIILGLLYIGTSIFNPNIIPRKLKIQKSKKQPKRNKPKFYNTSHTSDIYTSINTPNVFTENIPLSRMEHSFNNTTGMFQY